MRGRVRRALRAECEDYAPAAPKNTQKSSPWHPRMRPCSKTDSLQLQSKEDEATLSQGGPCSNVTLSLREGAQDAWGVMCA